MSGGSTPHGGSRTPFYLGALFSKRGKWPLLASLISSVGHKRARQTVYSTFILLGFALVLPSCQITLRYFTDPNRPAGLAQRMRRRRLKMNHRELVHAVAKVTGATKEDAKRHVEAMKGVIADALRRGEEVEVFGFGKFKRVHRECREGRNPRTGEPVTISAKKAVKFRPAKALQDAAA